MEIVAVSGASENVEKPSNLACHRLAAHGCRGYAVTQHGRKIGDAIGSKRVTDITDAVDTVTRYLNPENQKSIRDDLIAKVPNRVIFNPGTECEAHERLLKEAGVKTIRA